MNKKLTSRIAGGVALASAAALALAACSSGGGSSAGGSSGGTTTLKLVVADYGTGPSNTSAKYWGDHRLRVRGGALQHQGQRHHDPVDEL